MSWLRIEGRMPQHHKVAPLSDAAFRLHVTAMAWSVEGRTDGRIPKGVPATLTRAPIGKKLTAALLELTKSRAWTEVGDDFEIHDFLQWNLSAADIAARSEAKAKAGASGGKRSGEARGKRSASTGEAPASGVLPVAANLGEAESKPLPLPLPKSEEQHQQEVVVQAFDLDRETACPADIVLRAEEAGVFTELATALGVEEASLREEAGRFVGYWAVGAGAGKKRRHWMAKLRQRLVERAQSGELPNLASAKASGDDTGGWGKTSEWA